MWKGLVAAIVVLAVFIVGAIVFAPRSRELHVSRPDVAPVSAEKTTERANDATPEGGNGQSDQESVHAYHILVEVTDPSAEGRKAARAKAEKLLREIKNGASFEDVARRESEADSSAAGGDIGIVKKGELIPPLDRALFSLKNGQVSDVIESELGYSILMARPVQRAAEKEIIVLQVPFPKGNAKAEKEAFGRISEFVSDLMHGQAFEDLLPKYEKRQGFKIFRTKLLPGQLPPEIYRAALALRPGQSSDIIRTPFAYYVIFLPPK